MAFLDLGYLESGQDFFPSLSGLFFFKGTSLLFCVFFLDTSSSSDVLSTSFSPSNVVQSVEDINTVLSSSASCSSDASTTSSTPRGVHLQHQTGQNFSPGAHGDPTTTFPYGGDSHNDIPLDIKDILGTGVNAPSLFIGEQPTSGSIQVSDSDVAGFLNSIVPSPANPLQKNTAENANLLNNNLNQMNNNMNMADHNAPPSNNLFDDDMIMLHSPLSNWGTGTLWA